MRLRKREKFRRLSAIALACIFQSAVVLAGDEKTPAPKSTRPEPALVTRFYDLHPWAMPAFDFSLDSSAHSAAFITPANIQTDTFDYRLTGQRYPNRAERSTPTRQERIDSLTAMIEQTVAPESWRDAGGKGSLHEVRDILVVKQTPENQAEIAGLLQGLKDHQSETVRATADWFILSRDEAGKFRDDAGGNKGNIRPQSVDLAAIVKRSPGAPHFHADLLCLNGQTVSYISGRERSLLANEFVTTDAATASFAPFMANAGAGIAWQVNPVVDRQAKRATVTFFSTYTDPENPSAPIPVSASATAGALTASPTRASAPALVRSENGLVQEFRSTVRIPLATSIVVGSLALEPTAKKPAEEAKELVMILTVEPGE